MFNFQKIFISPELPPNIQKLKELAYNLWFSWHPDSQEIFSLIDENLWHKVKRNPVKFLLNVSYEKLEKAANDTNYLKIYKEIINKFINYLNSPTWFKTTFPDNNNLQIAYFSAEFGVHESNPVYSGGLGLLAGDHCKEASDLGLPLVGIGILYKQGYFEQRINRDGWQEAHNIPLDFTQKTVQPVFRDDGSEIIIPIKFPGRDIFVKVWHQKVGRICIYFLDADLPENNPDDRLLTSKLYGGDQLTRISQEIILGIGGVKALRELGLNPTVWHINEGHAAFSIIERLVEYTQKGLSFSIAKEIIRANSIFTTHTPVPAGHDVFPLNMIDGFFNHYYKLLDISKEEFLNLGQNNSYSGFNMTTLAIQNSNYTNTVSNLHCEVSKKMFENIYKDIPLEEIPLNSVTNGVHTESWIAPEMKKVFDKYFSKNWLNNISEKKIWQKVYEIPDKEIWETHLYLKEKMLNFVLDNISNRLKRNYESAEILRESIHSLKKDYLIIGFARRFATYKRAYLLFKDKERLAKLINNPKMPIRLIFAGKAHPADYPGQKMIKLICDLEKDPVFRGKIIFIENYDINVARYLLQGVDIWLNTPRRPFEASGTSGQKAAVNGAVNCSILDGWWPEAYNSDNGYAIGSTQEYNNDEIQDIEDTNSLFYLLEKIIIPTYYHQENNLPSYWIKKMKNSLATIPWFFSTERMVKEYCTKAYLPAESRGKIICTDNYSKARYLQKYKQYLKDNWDKINIKSITTNNANQLKNGSKIYFETEIYLGNLGCKDIIVEVVYGKVQDQTLINIELVPLIQQQEISHNTYKYVGILTLKSGLTGYTLRIRPNDSEFFHPFELPLIEWGLMEIKQ